MKVLALLRFLQPVGCRLLIGVGFLAGSGVPATFPRANAAQTMCSSFRHILVDVGGYRLNFRVIPGRAPTIVLESGGGADSSQWSSLQPELARVTGLAVVSYDRAGFGDSDLPSRPYNGFEEQPDIVISTIKRLIQRL